MSSSYLLALVLGLLLVVLTKPALGDYGEKPKPPKPPSVPVYKPPKPPVVPIHKPPAPIYKPPLPPKVAKPPPTYKPPYGDHPPALEDENEEEKPYKAQPDSYKPPRKPYYKPPNKPYYKPPRKPPGSN